MGGYGEMWGDMRRYGEIAHLAALVEGAPPHEVEYELAVGDALREARLADLWRWGGDGGEGERR